MNKRALRADILLLITAAIWGFGFVAQRAGMEFVGPFAFNGIRFILGSVFLLPLIFLNRKQLCDNNFSFYHILFPVTAAGICLFFAVALQQLGIIFTTAGNAGFITGFYVVLTPVFGIFLGRKTGVVTWVGCVITLAGLYFISIAGRASVNPGDILILVSAFFWAAHVLLIDRFMQGKNDQKESKIDELRSAYDPVVLSSGQFAVCGILSLLCAFLLEHHIVLITGKIDSNLISEGLFEWLPLTTLISTAAFPVQAVIPILYGGLASVGIAYTLQVVAQRDAPPAHAVIILCFEGCFAVLGGMLLLAEKASGWTLLGCGLMLAGMIATQWEVIAGNREQGTGSREQRAGSR